MDLFIFGTLLHLPLLKGVSGDEHVAERITPATRPGYTVSRVAGQVFPMIHADPDGVAQGVIVSGLTAQALARLDYYEKAFGYDRVTFSVFGADGTTREVSAYVPEPERWQPAEPWDCDAWSAARGELTTMTAIEAMSVMEDMPADQMGRLYPSMMARAASRLRAANSAPDGGMTRADVDVIAAHRRHTGFFNLSELDLTHKRFDGSRCAPINRTVMVGYDCAIVLPYDPVRDRVMLIEQFRPGAYLRGDPNPWVIEPVAGIIDPGETPQDAARREAREEAGIDLGALHPVSAAYPSPGNTTDYFFVYIGLCDLPDGSTGLGGVASEAEDIRSHLMEWDAFDTALNEGDFRLLPLVAAGHWLARNRDSLRRAG